MVWSEESIQTCLALWRADLKEMNLGTYTAPLPHPAMTNGRRVFKKLLKPPRELVHNRSGYQRGCRCDVCRADIKRYLKEWRERRKAIGG